MKDRQLADIWAYRETAWEAAFFKRLFRLAVRNRLSSDGARTPLELDEGVAYYQQCMYLAHRTAALRVASTVEFVEATAQLVHDAGRDGVLILVRDLEQRRRRALDEALTVYTAAAAHAADLEAIQRFGTSMLARGDAELRAKHRHGNSLAYRVPKIGIPRELYEIGQTRVEVGLGELISDPIVAAAPHSRQRAHLRSTTPTRSKRRPPPAPPTTRSA
jgi:hypothetical protein